MEVGRYPKKNKGQKGKARQVMSKEGFPENDFFCCFIIIIFFILAVYFILFNFYFVLFYLFVGV